MKKKLLKILILLILILHVPVGVLAFEDVAAFDLGVLEYRQGNYDKAAGIMQDIVEKSPNNFRAKYYLAITCVKLKEFKKAKDLYVEIISSSKDENLIDYSRKGLKYLDPAFYKEFKRDDFKIVEAQTQKTDTYQPSIVETSKKQTEVNLNPAQQTIVQQVAKENNISQEELNNLLKVLTQNPSALQTINKLANAKTGHSEGTYDPESVAKLVRMLTLNSQMGLLDFSDKSNKNNNNNDMMSIMMGLNGFDGNNFSSNNNFASMMNYLSDPSNKDKMNPQMINSLIKNNMTGGFGMGGF